MKADLTRDSFDPLKHFSRVVMQQGRVQLDADFNEQTAILLRAVRRLAVDTHGAVFSAAGGFAPTALPSGVTDDFEIASGAFYVDGILCETDSGAVAFEVGTGNTITIARWTVDEKPFRTGQLLRLWDDGPSPVAAPIVATVTKVDYDSRLLTLDASPGALGGASMPTARRVVTYLTQPDLANPPALPLKGAGPVQLYLDVWERLVTPYEDDSIREVALDGADTADRARVVWQVKAMPLDAKAVGCLTSSQIGYLLRGGPPGLLRARVRQGRKPTDPCTVPPGSSYRGAENQLYRVEVNTGGGPAAEPTFKWSRDNGSVIFPVIDVQVSASTTTVRLGNLGRDERFGVSEGDYVELQDDATVSSLAPAQLMQIQSIDRGRKSVVLAGTPGSAVGTDRSLHPLMRRWDHGGASAAGAALPAADGAMPITAGTLADGDAAWLALEDGIEVLFEATDAARLLPGDYWLIPARVATGNVLWPQETALDTRGDTVTNAVAQPPHGPSHHYAPLSIRDATLALVPCK